MLACSQRVFIRARLLSLLRHVGAPLPELVEAAEGVCVYACLLWADVTCRVSLPSCSPGLEVGQSQAEILARPFVTVLNLLGSAVAQSCPTLCDPTDCSTPGLPVHHQLLELAQTHVHRVGDATQPSHPLLSPSPPAFNLCQHQGLFKRVSSSHQVAEYCIRKVIWFFGPQSSQL